MNLSGILWTWSFQADQTDSSKRADVILLRAIESGEGSCTPPPITRSQLKRLMEESRVRVNGEICKASLKLQPGMKVEIFFPAPVATELLPEDLPLDIIYEDQDLAVINKPQGLTVHPSPTQMDSTLVHALLHHIKDLSGIGGVLRPGIVHRIDKNTSGALVITKNDLAHTRLAEIFSKHEIERSYWALCYGSAPSILDDSKKKVESLIARHPRDRKKMSMKVSQGKRAVTYFTRLAEYAKPNKKPFASWVEAQLETGRTHQVRVHLTGLGHSILGDTLYGTPTSNQSKWTELPKEIQALVKELPGQALHARVLGFKHPITGKAMRFEAKPPELFQKLKDTLELFEVD